MIIKHKKDGFHIGYDIKNIIPIDKFSIAMAKSVIGKLLVDRDIPFDEVKKVVNIFIEKYPKISHGLIVNMESIIDNDDVTRLEYIMSIRNEVGASSLIRYILGAYDISNTPNILSYLESLVGVGNAVNIGDFFYTDKASNLIRIIDNPIYSLDVVSTIKTLISKLKSSHRTMRLKLLDIFEDHAVLEKLIISKEILASTIISELIIDKRYDIVTQILYYYPIDVTKLELDRLPKKSSRYLMCKHQLNQSIESIGVNTKKINLKPFEDFAV